jgi:archaetidylinositol phosphate synthase
MVLNKYRGFSERILTPVARVLSGVHPNTISVVSLIFAFLAGFAFVFADKSSYEDIFKPGHRIYIMLAIASVCIFLNGFLDAIDGRVARLTNQLSKRGDLFDHALDRYADILILGGIMLSPYCDTVLGALAIIAVLMTSYMGTQAQALGCGRDYGGILGRADRLVILIIIPLLQMWVNYYIPSGRLPLPGMFRMTVLEYTMLWFFIAGNITALHRGIQSWRELREQEEQTQTRGQYIKNGAIKKPATNPLRSTTSKGHSHRSNVKPVSSSSPPQPAEDALEIDWEVEKPKTRVAKKRQSTKKAKLKTKQAPQKPIRKPPVKRKSMRSKGKPKRAKKAGKVTTGGK